eukprot:jgi/Mesvir1/16273/Mv08517-RA.1
MAIQQRTIAELQSQLEDIKAGENALIVAKQKAEMRLANKVLVANRLAESNRRLQTVMRHLMPTDEEAMFTTLKDEIGLFVRENQIKAKGKKQDKGGGIERIQMIGKEAMSRSPSWQSCKEGKDEESNLDLTSPELQ